MTVIIKNVIYYLFFINYCNKKVLDYLQLVSFSMKIKIYLIRNTFFLFFFFFFFFFILTDVFTFTIIINIIK